MLFQYVRSKAEKWAQSSKAKTAIPYQKLLLIIGEAEKPVFRPIAERFQQNTLVLTTVAISTPRTSWTYSTLRLILILLEESCTGP